MKHYELLYIIPNQYAEEEVETVIGKINDLVKKQSGEITLTDNLGNNKFAYPIGGAQSGNYIVVEFNAEPEKIRGLDSILKLAPEVLRHQIYLKKMKTAEEIEEERVRQKKMAEKVTAEKTALAPKVSLEELDKKLGEILDGDII